jgi:hypothetical protein
MSYVYFLHKLEPDELGGEELGAELEGKYYKDEG